MTDGLRLQIVAQLAISASRLGEVCTVADALDAIVHTVPGAVPGADHASISRLHRGGRIVTVAATDDLVRQVDEIQYETGEGPCVEALARGLPVADGRDDAGRWPQFAPRAAALGVTAWMAFLLSNDRHAHETLNIYSTQVGTFDDDARYVAQLFATSAALAMGKVRVEEQLTQALTTRKLIGQAIGIVMERYRLNEDQAFEFLVNVSRDSNVKLREIARQVIRTTHAQQDETGRKGASAPG
jgi:transcriptional regulator with GAF, ATPase, and Fis domain